MSFVRDVTESDFEQQVLARSREVPVVVDFWAEWCAPCRMLGPTLEREVNALGGKVELAKLDVDRAQALSQKFGVQGIPAVMAFRNGEVVADFVGARDAGFVRRWLVQTSRPRRRSRPSRPRRMRSRCARCSYLRRWARGRRFASLQLLLGAGRAAECLALLEGVRSDETERLRRRAGFAVDAQAFGGEAAAEAALVKKPDGPRRPLGARVRARRTAAGTGTRSRAFLGLVTTSRKYRDDGARKAMVTLFERLGPQHEPTRDYRRRLQNVL